MVKSLLAIAATGFLLAGCSERLEQFSGPTMGSSYSVKYVPSAATPAPEVLKAEVEGLLAQVDQQMSTWRDDSDLSQFNHLPAGQCREMPAPVLELLAFGHELHASSEGAFDLTLQPLLELWGFAFKSKGEQVPSDSQLREARARTGHQHLHQDNAQLCKDVALALDLNSIAAGYTVDLIGEHLHRRGIQSYLVEVTGELKAVGRKPDGNAWRVAIEAPRDDRQVAQKVLKLDGLGLSTSGDYRNYFEKEGRRYSHTLDPQTAQPITHQLASVTVVDASALRADGLSTLLMVLGPERGYAYAQDQGIAAFFISRESTGFVSKTTSAFDQHFSNGEKL